MSQMSQILFLRYRQRKHSNSFVLYCFQHWYIAYNSVTRCPIVMGFALECSIFELPPESGVKFSKLKIFDVRLISLDHVTYLLTESKMWNPENFVLLSWHCNILQSLFMEFNDFIEIRSALIWYFSNNALLFLISLYAVVQLCQWPSDVLRKTTT